MTSLQTSQAGSSLHQNVEQMVASSSDPFNLFKYREEFQRGGALQDVTINSNDSAMMLYPHNPLLVKEETEAAKDQFRRLKFTHLEQAAKRHFVFAITGDEPQGLSDGENERREAINVQKKQTLKDLKLSIYQSRDEAINMAKENSEKHHVMSKQVTEAQALQRRIREAELELARIRATHPPEKRVTISQAQDILDAQAEEIEKVIEAKTTTTQRIDVVRDEIASTTKDLHRLGREREREEARAEEVQRGREAGDTMVDQTCRWLGSSITFYKTLMGIRNVTAPADHTLHLEYDVPKTINSKGAVTLALNFNPYSKRLGSAQLLGSDIDISEAESVAVGSNDIPGLVADVLVLVRPMM